MLCIGEIVLATLDLSESGEPVIVTDAGWPVTSPGAALDNFRVADETSGTTFPLLLDFAHMFCRVLLNGTSSPRESHLDEEKRGRRSPLCKGVWFVLGNSTPALR